MKIYKASLLVMLLFFSFTHAATEIIESGKYALVADTNEWEFNKINFSAYTKSNLPGYGGSSSKRWFYWTSIIGKSNHMPVEFEFICINSPLSKWTRDRIAWIHPNDYLGHFFKVYNQRYTGYAAKEEIWLQSGYSGDHQYVDEGDNYYLRRSAMITNERKCGICEIYLIWEDFVSKDFNSGHEPNTYIMITRYNIPLQNLDSDTMKHLGDQTRALITQIK